MITPSLSFWVPGGGRGACCFNLCKYTAGGGRGGNKKKEPRFWISQSARGTGGAGRLNGPMADRADSKPAPASGCRLVGGDSRRHAPGAEPGGCRAATAEVGAGRARVSETEPQVAAGAGLGQSSGGECCPQDPPPNTLVPQPLLRSAPGSPGGHWGQRRGGARGMANWGWGAVRWAPPASPRPSSGGLWREIGTPLQAPRLLV